MITTEYASPFEGTPWNNDDEIYEFALHKRNQIGYDWEAIHSSLTAEGLNSDYAQAIIANLQEQENARRQSTERKWVAGFLSVLWAILSVYLIRPFAYSISPEYGCYIFIAIIGAGLTLINQYRKGE